MYHGVMNHHKLPSPLRRCPCGETVCADPCGHWDGHDAGAAYPQAAEAEGKIRALATN